MAEHSRRDFLLKGSSLASAVGVASLAGCLGNGDDGTYNLTMGGGSAQALSYSTGLGYQSVLRDHSDTVDISVQETGGSAANLRRYDEEQNMELFSTTADAYSRAALQDPPYDEEHINTLPMLGWSYGWSISYIVAREDTDIENVDDLPGHSVWPQWPAGIGYQGYQDLMEAYGIWDEIDVVNLGTGDVSGAIEEGQVDAAVVYETGTSDALPGWGVEIDSRTDMKLVDTTEEWANTIDELDHLVLEYDTPVAWEQDIGAHEVATSTSEWGMMIGGHTDPEPISEMLRTFHEHYDQLLDTDPAIVDFSQVEDVIRPVSALGEDFPVHPGVADVYQEWDVWDDNWQIGEVE